MKGFCYPKHCADSDEMMFKKIKNSEPLRGNRPEGVQSYQQHMMVPAVTEAPGERQKWPFSYER